MVDPSRFDALTFDCYGTLIDWEAGLLAGLRQALATAAERLDDDALLERFAVVEAELEARPYRTYRDILGTACRRIGASLGVEPDAAAVEAFGGSVVDWPAFADSRGALARLRGRFRLGVITNCDDDLFDASAERLGRPFTWVVTAEQVGSYKPDVANFEYAFARMDVPRERILHVAQSLFHDHVPAKQLGLTTAWIDRRAGRAGSGATPPAEVTPDLTAPDMKSFADLVLR
jgi:2-haloacid dehalogenase